MLNAAEKGFITLNGTLLAMCPASVTITDHTFLTVTGSGFCSEAAHVAQNAAFASVGTTDVLIGSISANHN